MNEVIKQQQKTLGELLIASGIITKEQLEIALKEQKIIDEPIGKILVRLGFVKEEDIINVLKGILVVIFEINEENFGIEVIFTKEIIKYRKILKLPAISSSVKGIINIREEVIPVISLNKIIFNKNDIITNNTRIIIVEYKNKTVGILVDNVIAIKNYFVQNFENLNKSSISEEQSYIAGIIKDKNKIITLIKPDFLFSEKIFLLDKEKNKFLMK